MDKEELDKQRQRIESLLMKAASTPFPEEAEALREKAAFLSIKFGIDDAEARYHANKPVGAKHIEFKMFAPYTHRKCELVIVISNYLGCVAVREAKLKDSTVWVFGFEEDLNRVKVMYANLIAQMHIELAGTDVPRGENAKAYRNSWLAGFIVGVKNRLARAYAQAQKESKPGTDMILKKSFEDVELAVRAMFPNVTSRSQASVSTSGSGYEAGKAVGERADIGQGRVPTSQNARAIK